MHMYMPETAPYLQLLTTTSTKTLESPLLLLLDNVIIQAQWYQHTKQQDACHLHLFMRQSRHSQGSHTEVPAISHYMQHCYPWSSLRSANVQDHGRLKLYRHC